MKTRSLQEAGKMKGFNENNNRVIQCVTDFAKYWYHLSDVPLEKIDLLFVQRFETHLQTVRKYSTNTTGSYLRRLKHIITFAKNKGYIEQNPFDNYKIPVANINHISYIGNCTGYVPIFLFYRHKLRKDESIDKR